MSRRKSYFALDCLVFRGSRVVIHASSSAGESVFFISESLTDSHSASMVQISSILLSSPSCPMVSSSLIEGKVQSFGVTVGSVQFLFSPLSVRQVVGYVILDKGNWGNTVTSNETYRMSVSSCARQSAHSSILIFYGLRVTRFPIRSH